MVTLIAFVVIFGTIVLFHELGHFAVAKLAGIRVYEFAIGFGPALGSVIKGETKYSLRIFPLGGFVKMAGMDEPVDGVEELRDDDERDFNKKSLPLRLGTIAAGPFMNFILAIVLFVFYFMLVAVPPTITYIEPNSPGELAGLLPGDVFVSINGEKVETTERVVELIGLSAEQEMQVEVKRQQELVTLSVIPENRAGLGRVGISIDSKPQYPFLTSLQAGVQQTWHMITQLIRDIARMITGKQKVEVSGPIGIVQIVGETAAYGLPNLMILAIILNVNLGLLNLLPVPVLDGGWILILLLEAVRGKPLAPEVRGVAQFIGLALLMALMLFATFKDLTRLNLFS
ncbi:MAG: RIP metalloprotease RseP [Bacillota bacterium]|jgi:regulator of sigma E protease|nr:RIP metalloprotease RseP [Bacillota bacterium]HHT91621.1 RIP metalloprotease RseP [Bacillota bacterium]